MPRRIFPKGRRHNISLAHKRAGRSGARAAPSSIQKRENVGWKNAWDTRFPSGGGGGVWSGWLKFFRAAAKMGAGYKKEKRDRRKKTNLPLAIIDLARVMIGRHAMH